MAFTTQAFTFLGQLEKHNRKDWFEAHRDDYEAAIRTPALAFIDEAAEWFETAGLPYVAEAKKVGGSLGRIHRDIRFSKDKSPYNTHAHMGFHHKGASEANPLPAIGIWWDKSGASVGGGCWMNGTPTLSKIRDRIVDDPKGWARAKKGVTFHDDFAPLKTAPRGYDKNHPLIADLKRTTFAADVPLTKAQFTGDLMGAFQTRYASMEPLLGFLGNALE
ncbi:MAG: TIGR02453 family protein [bacterium]